MDRYFGLQWFSCIAAGISVIMNGVLFQIQAGAIDTLYAIDKVTWEWGHVIGWNLSHGKTVALINMD